MKKLFLAAALVIASVTSTLALPQLQLDIAGGTYDPTSETIIANGNPFTLYAVYDAIRGTPSGSFYISAAIIQTGDGGFGSFSIDGTTYSSASGMQFGTPPVDSAFPDLDSHGVYPTHYAEIEFSFNEANRANDYDSADYPGGLVPNASGLLVYQAFTVNVTGLTAGTRLHFDLYDTFLRRGTGNAAISFAPFSNDAQSGNSVPEGGVTIVLLATGLMGCHFFSKKFGKTIK